VNVIYVQAFPCISTGIYGYPNDKAAEVALKTVRSFLEKHHQVQAAVFWIRITLMRIRTRLITLIQIRKRIRILIFI
jgi:O-acetyl-ADP-ribose deacetylase (regulator of RNase III)